MSIAGKAMKIATNTLQEMKRSGEKITMLTAYDYSMARILDSAGIDVILVGDSASNVMAGNDTTVPITLDQMIYHAQCVVNGVDGSNRLRYALWKLPRRFETSVEQCNSNYEGIRCTCE